MDEERYNWISRRAHEIWRIEGCPEGRDREHWSQAVTEREALEQGSPACDDALNAPKIERVLLVDDEPIIRFAAADALEEAGFVVLEAANADEALSLLKHSKREFPCTFCH